MFKNLRKKKKGFTLIELIIVIAIIAILAAIAIPKFGDVTKNAKVKSDVANAKTIANATSALIAEGEIKVVKAEDLTINKKENNENEKKVEKYLQNVPVPQTAGYTNYLASIDKDGNVTVKMIGGDNKPRNLYPTLEEEPKAE